LPSSLAAVLDWHRRHYPLLEARDVYKLAHQGVFGPGHAVASAVQAQAHLSEEIEAFATQVKRQKPKAKGQEELLEPIDHDGRLVRVNLVPLILAAEVRSQKSEYRRQSAGADWLAEAMVESARRVKGEPKVMRRRLAAAVRWCRKNLPRHAAGLERLAVEAEEAGYPAFHHSPAYRRAYRPAYRVVLRTLATRTKGEFRS